VKERDLDIVVYGATGFTGRLVAEHLLEVYGESRDLNWAMAGRERARLEEVRSQIGASANLPLITANSSDPASLAAMVRRTKVIATTAGPYQLHGGTLVAACAEQGTDYVDISGEAVWIHDMLAHEVTSRASGARIVFCCGFNCAPFDLGVYFLQQEANTRFGAPMPRVRCRVRRLERGVHGGQSGGSLATAVATRTAAQSDPRIRSIYADPFALTPGFTGPDQPDASKPYEDVVTGSWVAPFTMAAINAKVVHRSNYLVDHAWGTEFKYDEMSFAAGPAGPAVGAPSYYSVGGVPPKPGEGPSKAEREGGCYDILFIGEAAHGPTLRVCVKGDMDPGAGSTARMLGESAVCLACEISPEITPGGMWTPTSGMGMALIRRLATNAGVSFEVQ
jgi:short subunit dehydrogenase-like uncharacterized protein